jgi:glycosyltransferase involved in cell wall biosynthesis
LTDNYKAESATRKPHSPVLVVALAQRYGGIEARVVQMAIGLKREGIPCMVAATSASPLHAEMVDRKLDVIPSPYSPKDPRNVLWLARLVRRTGASVVDAQNPQSYLMAMLAASVAGVPGRVCTVHLDFRTFASVGLKVRALDTLILMSRTLNAEFLAVSDDSARYLRDVGVPPEQVAVTINAVTIPDGCTAADIRSENGWAEDDFVVVVPARLEAQKGHRFLLEAMARLKPTARPIRCLLVGEGVERAAIEADIACYGLAGSIKLAGFRRDAIALIRAANLVCLPSVLEGLPFAALEAALCERPLLMTRVGGIPDHFVHGITAQLVAPRDQDALAVELAWCADNPSHLTSIAIAARDMVAERFSTERMISELRAAYARALVRRAALSWPR